MFPWLELALAEWGVKENNPGSDARIEGYFLDALGFRLPDNIAWCGAFASAMLKRAGKTIPTNPNAADPKAFRLYGVGQPKPIVGAVAVKKDATHVAFVLAVSQEDPNVFLAIGGNQDMDDDDAVTVIQRHAAYFESFRVVP
jgi:uncharacterized protein (TIGR02594 family)